MTHNFLQLNQDKTEIIIIGDRSEREKLAAHLNTLGLSTKHQVKNLGVLIDPDLKFESHIKNITKISFYHLRNIVKVRPLLSQADTEKLIHAFVSTRLDYCNALLAGLPQKSISS